MAAAISSLRYKPHRYFFMQSLHVYFKEIICQFAKQVLGVLRQDPGRPPRSVQRGDPRSRVAAVPARKNRQRVLLALRRRLLWNYVICSEEKIIRKKST